MWDGGNLGYCDPSRNIGVPPAPSQKTSSFPRLRRGPGAGYLPLMARHSPFRSPALAAAILLVLGGCAGNGSEASGSEASAPDLGRCLPAERYLTEQLGMVAETGPDTMDDWRTDLKLPACRVTAAGSTSLPARDVAEGLYAGLFATGWTRSPDPQDAPEESSFRLRQGGSECLFSFYDNIALGTAAELRVTSALIIPPGEKRYNVLAQCTPLMESAG